MKGYVLDASITLAWCFSDEETPVIKLLLERLAKETAHVPAIWTLELGNILVGAEKKGRISFAEIIKFIKMIKCLNINIDPETAKFGLQDTLTLAYSEKIPTMMPPV